MFIDQSSILERDQQASIMGKIYKQAQHVYVYLGGAGGRSGSRVDERVAENECIHY